MKTHPKYPKYKVDHNGNIYGPRKQLKPTKHHTGYLVVGAGYKQHLAHRFIWETLFGEIPIHLVIDHIDGNKHNNHPSNLRLVTNKENTNAAIDLKGTWNLKGEQVVSAKLTNETFQELVQDLKAGLDNTAIGEKYGLNSGYVSLIRHQKRWQAQWALIEGSETIPKGSTHKVMRKPKTPEKVMI